MFSITNITPQLRIKRDFSVRRQQKEMKTKDTDDKIKAFHPGFTLFEAEKLFFSCVPSNHRAKSGPDSRYTLVKNNCQAINHFKSSPSFRHTYVHLNMKTVLSFIKIYNPFHHMQYSC